MAVGQLLRRPLLVVSPHLDDAVLSCGRLLAAHPGAIVVTVFAGEPPPGTPLTQWDRDGGFPSDGHPVLARRDEDERALAALGAEPRWLDFLDSQYGQPQAPIATIAVALEHTIEAVRPRTVLMPLGLVHRDHYAVARTLDELLPGRPCLDWVVYEEALYSRTGSPERDRAIAALGAGGWAPVPVTPRLDSSPERKREAIACYPSQVRALLRRRVRALDEAQLPERYWRIQSLGEQGAHSQQGAHT